MRDLKTLTLKKELEIKRRNIMTPKWTSALAAVIALALSGISPPSSAAESMDTAAAHQVYSHGAKADYLAGYHMQNKLTANCLPATRRMQFPTVNPKLTRTALPVTAPMMR